MHCHVQQRNIQNYIYSTNGCACVHYFNHLFPNCSVYTMYTQLLGTTGFSRVPDGKFSSETMAAFDWPDADTFYQHRRVFLQRAFLFFFSKRRLFKKM